MKPAVINSCSRFLLDTWYDIGILVCNKLGNKLLEYAKELENKKLALA